jgi:membrane protein CcdC involved in cytochrome C biogenesis
MYILLKVRHLLFLFSFFNVSAFEVAEAMVVAVVVLLAPLSYHITDNMFEQT